MLKYKNKKDIFFLKLKLSVVLVTGDFSSKNSVTQFCTSQHIILKWMYPCKPKHENTI